MPRPTLRLTGVFLAVLAIGLAIAWALNADNNADVAEVGGPAPDFTVSLIGGGKFSLSDQLAADDTPIVLNLWASWCIPCRTETPEISAFAEEHPDVKVIGVAVEDTEDGAIEFAEEFMPSYQLGIGDIRATAPGGEGDRVVRPRIAAILEGRRQAEPGVRWVSRARTHVGLERRTSDDLVDVRRLVVGKHDRLPDRADLASY